MWSCVSLLAAFLLGICNAQKVIDLSGTGWTVRDSNGSISIPGHVPSDLYLDLYNHGVIGDPLYGFNDVSEMWGQLSNWTYTSPTINSLEHGHGTRTWLVFEGLDTWTYITICNQTVGNTNNQYRQFLFDVTDVLSACEGAPKLSLDFGSAVKITQAIASTSSADPTDNFDDSCHVNQPFSCKVYARKEQNDFGWDWSPSLAPVGPWRPMYVVQLTQKEIVYVNNVDIDIYRQRQLNNLPPDQSQPWVFNASLDFIGDLPLGASLQMMLRDASGNTVIQTALSGVYTSTGTITGTTTIDPSKVMLWWPNGMGAQNLYNTIISIIDGNNCTVTEIQRRVGFRTIVLNLEPISPQQIAKGIQAGANWHFEINGHEMYAKGSNLVPPSPFWPSVNETKMRHLFELVTEGNQNMLRVWASGTYLADWIYDVADEMGILLWSEFQFTDAEYPNGTEWLENYQAEAYYNHTFFSATNPGATQLQYEQIFLELLIKCVYANTRSISYIPSSTYHGYLELDFHSTMPQLPRYLNTSGPDALYIDSDSYNYYAPTAFNPNDYPIGRFADEFGFHSMPSLQAWETEAPPTDFYLESPVVSLAGIEQMVAAVEIWYPTPNLVDPVANFSAWIYSTQVFQAADYQAQIAFYRRGSGMPNRQLGSLYWMLEDIWAAPTWSSIDVLGRQKVVYYATKAAYKPVIVYAYYNSTSYNMQVWVTSDLWSTVSGTVTYEWLDFYGNLLSVRSESPNATTPPAYGKSNNPTSSVPFMVGPINATKIVEYHNVTQSLSSSCYNVSNAVLRLSVTGRDRGKEYTHTSWFHPASLANVTLHDPGLALTRGVRGSRGSSVEFTVKATKAVAAWVWIDYTATAVEGYWSDNGFWLNRGEGKTVTFTVWNDWSGGEWIDSVNVRSLYDNTMH